MDLSDLEFKGLTEEQQARFKAEYQLQDRRDKNAMARTLKECENRKEVALINQETERMRSKTSKIVGGMTLAGVLITVGSKLFCHFSDRKYYSKREDEGLETKTIERKTGRF